MDVVPGKQPRSRHPCSRQEGTRTRMPLTAATGMSISGAKERPNPSRDALMAPREEDCIAWNHAPYRSWSCFHHVSMNHQQMRRRYRSFTNHPDEAELHRLCSGYALASMDVRSLVHFPTGIPSASSSAPCPRACSASLESFSLAAKAPTSKMLCVGQYILLRCSFGVLQPLHAGALVEGRRETPAVKI